MSKIFDFFNRTEELMKETKLIPTTVILPCNDGGKIS